MNMLNKLLLCSRLQFFTSPIGPSGPGGPGKPTVAFPGGPSGSYIHTLTYVNQYIVATVINNIKSNEQYKNLRAPI